MIVSGHVYKIYARGRVEGFKDDVKIIKGFFRLHSDPLREAKSLKDESGPQLKPACHTQSHCVVAAVQDKTGCGGSEVVVSR